MKGLKGTIANLTCSSFNHLKNIFIFLNHLHLSSFNHIFNPPHVFCTYYFFISIIQCYFVVTVVLSKILTLQETTGGISISLERFKNRYLQVFMQGDLYLTEGI